MGVFAAVNHAFVPAPNPSLSENILITPTVLAVPQTITARKTTSPITESQPGDEFNIAKLRSKTVKVLAHAIAMGENYWTIAKNNGIDIYTLIGANPTMPFKAKINQPLNLLSRKGVLYTAQKGDDPSKIAQAFGADEKTIKTENGITWWKGLKEGDVLFIPSVKPIFMVKEWKDYFSKRGIFGDPLGRWGKINSPFSFRTDPITGEIRHHNGVDLKAKYGDPVYAAAGGKVIFTGVSGGYGNLIIIASANAYHTYYGHLSKIYAKQGQKIRRGILIGRVGATGRVTGPHLHFEIRKNGKPVDPLLYI
jgi:murein DD-endopeptidase MepM/ murein hydrolase activator NlpD